jgi:hypothetical protein
MKLGIMQPYFFPYIGYFQLINAVDKFVIYDNIQFSKNSWINRNRFLLNGEEKMFTIPLKKDSDYLNIDQRQISANFDKTKVKTLRQLRDSYKNAPFYVDAYELFESCILYETENLFDFILHSIKQVMKHLKIETPIYVSSHIDFDHDLAGQDKVLGLCKKLDADIYINSIGGKDLYGKSDFCSHNIDLNFLNPKLPHYKQYELPFISKLSILDELMFMPVSQITDRLVKYQLE